MAGVLAFWLSNTSELLHFLRRDYRLCMFAHEYENTLTSIIHMAYKHFTYYMVCEIMLPCDKCGVIVCTFHEVIEISFKCMTACFITLETDILCHYQNNINIKHVLTIVLHSIVYCM